MLPNCDNIPVTGDLDSELDFLEQIPETLEDCFKILSTEARDLYLSRTVPILDHPPTPLQFYRDYVSYNRPVLIRSAVSHWPALDLWRTNEYFRRELGSTEVTVAVTPNGLADSPVGDRFVLPEERRMKFSKFLDILENPESEPGIFYIQKQNSNLTQELPQLVEQVPELSWASQAFGKSPDAVNFWLGDKRAVTSMHKDPYENIYTVIRGYKDILLHPPTDLPWIPYRQFTQAVYKSSQDKTFSIQDIEGGETVPWICIDPLNPDLNSYPEYFNTTPIKVRVYAGETLYLPSLWFHHLSQSQGCVSVNYWYDMEFDIKYNYFNLIKNIKQLDKQNKC